MHFRVIFGAGSSRAAHQRRDAFLRTAKAVDFRLALYYRSSVAVLWHALLVYTKCAIIYIEFNIQLGE